MDVVALLLSSCWVDFRVASMRYRSARYSSSASRGLADLRGIARCPSIPSPNMEGILACSQEQVSQNELKDLEMKESAVIPPQAGRELNYQQRRTASYETFHCLHIERPTPG